MHQPGTPGIQKDVIDNKCIITDPYIGLKN